MDPSHGRPPIECYAGFDWPPKNVQAIEDVPVQATGEHKNMHPPQQFLERRKREIGGTSSTDQRIMDRSNERHSMVQCWVASMIPDSMIPPVPEQATGEHKNMQRKREIGGTSSTDQRIMDRSNERHSVVQCCVDSMIPPVPEQATGEHKNMQRKSHEVSLDINEIANSLTKRLEIKKAFSQACCIYRVPERLRKLNEMAYTPRVVSIGPIHHGMPYLNAMEDHKIMYLQQFLEQNKVRVEDLINIIKENEMELRDSYAETIYLRRNGFATMILLDAVFIIMFLLNRKYWSELYDRGRSDHIFYRPFKFSDVVFDMCLLENQLPFFILEKFFELSSEAENCTLTELTCELLNVPWPDWVKEDSWKTINSSTEIDERVLHFVDFLIKCQQPKKQCRATKAKTFFEAPTATELYQSGMKFKNSKKSSLLDITFSNGILEIPQLKIEDSTEILFRNLQAFEQCHHRYKDNFVSNYITFICRLVRDPNDVKVLDCEGNLKNMLNSERELLYLFYRLQKDIFVTDGYLSDVGEDLKSYCRKRRHKWMATLKQVYFNNPWTGISVFAATFLLILTVIQTVCSILQLR